MGTMCSGKQPVDKPEQASAPEKAPKLNDGCIIIIGPPGSGKGTHAPKLVEILKIPHLSTGDLLRAEAEAKTELGLKAKELMDKGDLVPDELVNNIVAGKVSGEDCKNGFILDGYPRTVEQAGFLDKALEENGGRKITHVIQLKVPDEELKERILGRLIHKPSGRSYHTKFNPPKEEMKDDLTGEPLIKRGDDNEESLGKRLAKYHEQTAPVVEHYTKKDENCVYPIDATCKPDEVWERIMVSIKEELGVEEAVEEEKAVEKEEAAEEKKDGAVEKEKDEAVEKEDEKEDDADKEKAVKKEAVEEEAAVEKEAAAEKEEAVESEKAE